MRAILVSVDFTDLLTLTLPYNRHHFESVTVITTPQQKDEVLDVARAYEVDVLATDLFYARAATFNKWAALEWGLDQIGRHGVICLMDVDIAWPKIILPVSTDTETKFSRNLERLVTVSDFIPLPGRLYTPRRRICPLPLPKSGNGETSHNLISGYKIPSEEDWGGYPIYPEAEWAGYSQIFHADDPALGNPPWHEVDWKHAGGADSFFQMKWGSSQKLRPPFEVLHIGEPGCNWMGRTEPYVNGRVPDMAKIRLDNMAAMFRERRSKGRHPLRERYAAEKLPAAPSE